MKQEKKGLPEGPQYSPKLKMASSEIKEILKKYDIAGVIQLFEPGFNELCISIAPTWSVVDINGAGQLRINPPLVDPLNEQAAKQKISDTVNMLANMKLYSGKLYTVLMQADLATRQHFNIMPPPSPRINGHIPPKK